MTRLVMTTAIVNPATDTFPLAGEDIPLGQMIELRADTQFYIAKPSTMKQATYYAVALVNADKGTPVQAVTEVKVGTFEQFAETHYIVLRTLPDAIEGTFTNTD